MQRSEGTVTVLDTNAITYSRIWCSFEIYTSIKEGKHGNTRIGKGTDYIYDVITLLDDGSTAVGLQDQYRKSDVLGQLPLDVCRKVIGKVKCEDAQASVHSDAVHILNRIAAGPGKALSEDELNAPPPTACANYESVNNTLKAKFANEALKPCVAAGDLELLRTITDVMAQADAMPEVKWGWLQEENHARAGGVLRRRPAQGGHEGLSLAPAAARLRRRLLWQHSAGRLPRPQRNATRGLERGRRSGRRSGRQGARQSL